MGPFVLLRSSKQPPAGGPARSGATAVLTGTTELERERLFIALKGQF